MRVTATQEISGSTITWHGYLTDVSIRKRYEMEIEELAFFDPLTKLPNRRLFLTRMTQAIAGCAARGDNDVLLFIDLDNFKTLNDTQGHDIGDAFLVKVAERLRRCLSPKDLVARIGGDEFVVIIEEAGTDAARATRRGIGAANQVLSALHDPFELGALNHVASASVGIVVFDGAEQRPDELLKRADIAMYQAKAAGRNGMALFDPATMDRESERYRLLSDLRQAFKRQELELFFQVQVDDTGAAIGAEGLLRWNHPEFGMVFPDRFIPLAEQFGLNDELTRYVLDAGVGVLAGWQRDPDTTHLRLSLNVSVQSFNTDDFARTLAEIVDVHGIDASKLTLELTEHVMAQNHEHVAGRMAEVKKLGVRLSLDDFGTGYSSLAYLKTLPLDEVKIDGGFIADLEHAESNRALVKTILVMARNLGLAAVAEHVENVRQEAFLRAFGCDFFQGYLYGRAVPAAEFTAKLAETTRFRVRATSSRCARAPEAGRAMPGGLTAARGTRQIRAPGAAMPQKRFRVVRLLAIVSLVIAEPAAALAASRNALVIGNSSYRPGYELRNPVADARAVARSLSQLGFAVTLVEDTDLATAQRALDSFVPSATAGDAAVIYYAGHGAMIEGRSFLLPVDFSMASFDAVDREALDAERLMQALSSTHSAFKLLVLDACRNNPLETRGATPLQRETDAPPPPRTENMLIAFSTTQGATALDGTGEHSPFAEGLIRHIGETETDVDALMKKVSSFVRDKTEGRQTVWIEGSMTRAFFLAGGAPGAGAVTTLAPPEPAAGRRAGVRRFRHPCC